MTSSQPAGWTAAELAQAAARGQLDLHYQPLVDLRDHRIAGAEALMRWRHPRLGLLPPGQFLPLAESFGLMPEIGAWVLGEACRQMHKWQGPAWQPFRLAINVSASQVGPTFDDEVKRVLADMALPAELLEIELTESVAFGNPALFASFDALRAIGVRFAADDFGTMIAGGLTCMLVGQAFLNMACATGLFPTTGKPLPFISSGGSSVVASLLMVGIIMSVSRVAGEEALTPHRASAERRRANLNYIRVEDEPPARSRFSSSESAPVVDAPVRSRRSHGDPFGGLMAPRGGASRNASRGSSRPEGNASLGSRASRRNDSGMERGANRRGSGRNSR